MVEKLVVTDGHRLSSPNAPHVIVECGERVQPRLFFFAAVFGPGEAVHQSEHHAREDQREVNDDHPHQFMLCGVLDVDKVFEDFDTGNGDDGADQFEFEIREANVSHPVGTVFVAAGVDLGK